MARIVTPQPLAALLLLTLVTRLHLRAVDALDCGPGYYIWIRNGIEHCRLCAAGCACAGNVSACLGCSGGFFSAASGASACSSCPPGTTTDYLSNSGCDPDNYSSPCANRFGPLGYAACRSTPPASTQLFAMPNGAVPPQNPLVPLQTSY